MDNKTTNLGMIMDVSLLIINTKRSIVARVKCDLNLSVNGACGDGNSSETEIGTIQIEFFFF